jgi:hypothetical protein
MNLHLPVRMILKSCIAATPHSEQVKFWNNNNHKMAANKQNRDQIES